jgi:hypothetical protein
MKVQKPPTPKEFGGLMAENQGDIRSFFPKRTFCTLINFMLRHQKYCSYLKVVKG